MSDDPRPSEPPDAPSPPKKRETPWSVFIVAGIFFAIGLWFYLDVRREVKEAEEAARNRPPPSASAKPKILGLDVIPQETEKNEATLRPATPGSAVSAAPSASGPSASAPSASGPSAPASSSAAPSAPPSASAPR